MSTPRVSSYHCWADMQAVIAMEIDQSTSWEADWTLAAAGDRSEADGEELVGGGGEGMVESRRGYMTVQSSSYQVLYPFISK